MKNTPQTTRGAQSKPINLPNINIKSLDNGADILTTSPQSQRALGSVPRPFKRGGRNGETP